MRLQPVSGTGTQFGRQSSEKQKHLVVDDPGQTFSVVGEALALRLWRVKTRPTRLRNVPDGLAG